MPPCSGSWGGFWTVLMLNAPLRAEAWFPKNMGSGSGLVITQMTLMPRPQPSSTRRGQSGIYRARSRRSSFSRICTVMAVLWDRADCQWAPSHSCSHQGSFRVGATSQNIPVSAWGTSPALQRGTQADHQPGRADFKPGHGSLGPAPLHRPGPWLSHLTSDHPWAGSSCAVLRVQTPGPWAPRPG